MNATTTTTDFSSLVDAGLRRRRERLAKETGRSCSHNDGMAHDCDYVRRRNALIPAAEREAIGACIAARAPTDGELFTRVFFGAMEAAAIDAGLTDPPGPWLVERRRDAEAEGREGKVTR